MPVFSSPDHSTQSRVRLGVVARNRRDSDRRPASRGGRLRNLRRRGRRGSATGGFDTNTQETVEVDQFAHFEQDGDVGLSFDGISFTYDSVGFDLGLLAEGDRQAVIESAPTEGEPGYESLIGFHGEMTIGPGPILTWWLLTAPLVIVNLRGHRDPLEEE